MPTPRCSAPGDDAPTGVNAELVRLVRSELDAHGFGNVQIVVSGGFTADRIRAFEADGVPVDAYGVGSSLIRGSNDFTADVVMYDGRPGGKVGRELRPNPRLSRRDADERHEPHALELGERDARRCACATTSRCSPSSTGATSRPPAAELVGERGRDRAAGTPRRR